MSTERPRAATHDDWLDWLRALAALLVLVGHVRGGFFAKWGDLDAASHNAVNFALFAATRMGHEAVMVFFVLSGYLVGGVALLQSRAGRFRLGEYLVARSARLYTVFLPAVALTLLLDYARGDFHAAEIGPLSLASQVTFLYGMDGLTLHSNAPFWSLAYEWWFYVMFGLALWLLGSSPTRWQRWTGWGTLGAIACLIAWAMPDILVMFPLWLLGTAIRIAPRTPAARWKLPSTVLLFLAVAVITNLRQTTIGYYFVALSAAMMIHALPADATLRGPVRMLGSFGAAISFSVYAVHYPVWLLVESTFLSRRLTHAGLAEWGLFAAVVFGVGTCCCVFYWLTERHTARVRYAVQALWQRARALRPRPAAQAPQADSLPEVETAGLHAPRN